MTSDAGVVLRRDLLLTQPYVAPRNAAERKLSDIRCNVLSMDRVGVDDNYNDLGGDSLAAIMMFTLIRQAFGIEVPVATLINAPTIAELASEIERRQASKAEQHAGETAAPEPRR